MYGFCGAAWLSAMSFCCARLKAEVSTSVLGGFVLDVNRVVFANGSLSSACLIHTLINISHVAPSTDAAYHICFLPTTSLNTGYHLITYQVLHPDLKRSATMSPSLRRGTIASVITLTSSRPYCSTSSPAIKIFHKRTWRVASTKLKIMKSVNARQGPSGSR